MAAVTEDGNQFVWWCPACIATHAVPIKGADAWAFNGSLVTPTLSPSVANNGRLRCHVFVRHGKIDFCSDSGHALAHTTVALTPPPPEA